MTTVAIVKLIEAKGKTALDAAIAAYIAGAGSILNTNVRAMSMAAFRDVADDSNRVFAAIAHAGDVMPASKVADNQFIFLEADTITALQTSLNTALGNIVHHRNATGDLNTTPGSIIVTGATFQATDVGRTVRIAGNLRTISGFTSATQVAYSGGNLAGTSQVIELMGAECISQCHVETFRERDTDPHFSIFLACEGQTV